MPSRVLEPLQFPAVRPVRDDLFVRAVSVQGGESDIAGEKTAFARITMTGVGLASSATNTPAPRRQETAVLKLSEAEDLAAQLGELLSFMARSTPDATGAGHGALGLEIRAAAGRRPLGRRCVRRCDRGPNGMAR